MRARKCCRKARCFKVAYDQLEAQEKASDDDMTDSNTPDGANKMSIIESSVKQFKQESYGKLDEMRRENDKLCRSVKKIQLVKKSHR